MASIRIPAPAYDEEERLRYVFQPAHTPTKNRPKNDPARAVVRMRMYPDTTPTNRKKKRRREPPRQPTRRKELARDAFTKTQHCLAQSPWNEQHAYWRLSLNTGYSSFNYWTHLHLHKILRWGYTCADIAHPHTFVSEPEDAPSIPVIRFTWPNNDRLYLDFHAILDPGTYQPNDGSRYPNCAYYVWDRITFDPFGYAETGYVFNPFVNKQNYNYWLSFPPGESYNPFKSRTIEFRKQIQETDRECILWNFEIVDSFTAADYRQRGFTAPEGVGAL